jgi:hypothetical protein
MNPPTIQGLWAEAGFTPNDNQRDAVLHTEGPLFLNAGKGTAELDKLQHSQEEPKVRCAERYFFGPGD